jgi:hypothetical protein
MTITEAKNTVIEIVSRANLLVPKELKPDLKALEGYPDVPSWHKFEIDVWNFGEDIRQILEHYKPLRKDKDLLDLFLTICLNRNSKRGRQTFIMLFEFKHCVGYAKQIVSQLNDKFVEGHVIRCLNKMQAGGFGGQIKKFTEHKVRWIRNEAKKYMEKYP